MIFDWDKPNDELLYLKLFKSLGLRFFNVFESNDLCTPRLHLFDQKYSKNCNIVILLLQVKVTVYYFNITFLKDANWGLR